jgi:hypothetical protein
MSLRVFGFVLDHLKENDFGFSIISGVKQVCGLLD